MSGQKYIPSDIRRVLEIDLMRAVAIAAMVSAFITGMSRNVMKIYIIHWLMIGLLSPLLYRIRSIWLSFAVGIAVLIAAYFGAKLFDVVSGKLRPDK
ncbi:MAG: hypothetical protein II695_06160 [Oscillospiraceae bacterium]|nr:hypothetical protein [Oscillospiraceae bacterium]